MNTLSQVAPSLLDQTRMTAAQTEGLGFFGVLVALAVLAVVAYGVRSLIEGPDGR